MALRKCPKCGKMVSSYSDTCANCGFNFSELNKAENDFRTSINEMFQQYVDASRFELEKLARDATDKIMSYLNKKYDGDTAAEIYLTFLSTIFSADGHLSFEEYEFLDGLLNLSDLTFDDCLHITQSYLDNNDIEMIDEIINAAPKKVKEAVAILCITIASIDKTITPKEKGMCMKYLFMSFDKEIQIK